MCYFCYVSILHLTTIRLYAEGLIPIVPAYSVGIFVRGSNRAQVSAFSLHVDVDAVEL